MDTSSTSYPAHLTAQPKFGQEHPNLFSFQDWTFIHSQYPILDTSEMQLSHDYLNKKLEGEFGEKLNYVQKLPEMFYGRNRLIILNSKLDVCLIFSPFDAFE
jgi:hypothetical protein